MAIQVDFTFQACFMNHLKSNRYLLLSDMGCVKVTTLRVLQITDKFQKNKHYKDKILFWAEHHNPTGIKPMLNNFLILLFTKFQITA